MNYKQKRKIKYKTTTGCICVVMLCLLLQSAFAEINISETDKHAWSENAGWLDFRPGNFVGVTVYESYLKGYVWAENIGWIKLGVESGGPYNNEVPGQWGVNRDNEALSGYAWSEILGWIDFNPARYNGVTIDSLTGSFNGYAWSENAGWIHFKNEEPWYNVAYIISGQHTTFSIPLVIGWNWISINVETDDMSLNTVLASINGSADFIQSEDASSEYSAAAGWSGDLTDINPTKMYMIHMIAEDTLTFEGAPVDASTPIALFQGWNWIGYLPQTPLTLNAALASIDGRADRIKTNSWFSEFSSDFRWYENKLMKPGQGFQINMTTQGKLVYSLPAIRIEEPETIEEEENVEKDAGAKAAGGCFIETAITYIGF